MTATFAARASPTSFLIAGSAATQRGRLGQSWFTKSTIINAVDFGSTVTALISGAVGVFTFAHSSIISEATAFEIVPPVVTQITPTTAQLMADRLPIACAPRSQPP